MPPEVARDSPFNHQACANSGRTAWLKVLGCFLTYINTYGVATSFGVYQTYYQFHALESYSASTISWLGTIQIFLMGSIGVIAGPLFDRGYARSLLLIGSFLVSFGFFMLSLSRTYWQVLLAQSICIGTGTGLIYVPAVAAVSASFTTQRPIANGLAATGSSVGGTLFPIMFRSLTPVIGFGWTNRIFGFLTMVTGIAAIMLLLQGQHRQPAQRHSNFFDASALTEPPFLLLCLGLFFVDLGFWIPPFTITPYAQLSLDLSADYAFNLLAIMNAGSAAGRVLPAFLAQVRRIGPAWVLVGGSMSLGAIVLSWLAVHDKTGITTWAVFVGFMSGIYVSIPNAVVPKLTPYTSAIGARSGMMWAFVSLAALVGAPISGVLSGRQTRDYTPSKIFSGLTICVGALVLCFPAVRVMHQRME